MSTGILLQQLVNGLSVGFGYALIALSLTLAFGVLHVINFGHGEIVMLGALSTVIAQSQFGLPYLAALPLRRWWAWPPAGCSTPWRCSR